MVGAGVVRADGPLTTRRRVHLHIVRHLVGFGEEKEAGTLTQNKVPPYLGVFLQIRLNAVRMLLKMEDDILGVGLVTV